MQKDSHIGHRPCDLPRGDLHYLAATRAINSGPTSKTLHLTLEILQDSLGIIVQRHLDGLLTGGHALQYTEKLRETRGVERCLQ